LRASQAAAAIERGLEAEGFLADLCPATDGGPGTLETLLVALGGEAARGGFALVEGGHTAIAETPAALAAALDSGASVVVYAGPAADAPPRDRRVLVPDARFVLDALDFNPECSRPAVITGGAALRPHDLRGTLISRSRRGAAVRRSVLRDRRAQ
jgi:hypothetical protein